MFVSQLAENDFPNNTIADLPPQREVKGQHSSIGTHSGGLQKNKNTASAGGNYVRKHLEKAVLQKKNYSEEVYLKDSRSNIYTGNPGYYTTAGDTVYFGTVNALSDSAFLQAQRTVISTTVKPYGIVGKERIVLSQDWVLGMILILWMIFASVRVEFPQYLAQIFSSILNFNSASRLFRQRGYKTMYGAFRLDLIFYFNLPLSVFQIAQYFKFSIPGYPLILLFIGLFLVINLYFFIKILVHRLVGSMAMLKDQADELVFNIRLYYRALGFVLLPVITVHTILPQTNFITIWVMAVLIVLMYLSTVIRSIYLGYQKGISIFYLILYLCTLEILPLLLIFKLIIAS